MRGRGITVALAAVLLVAGLALVAGALAAHRHGAAETRSAATPTRAVHHRPPVVLGTEAFRRPGTATPSVVAAPAAATRWSVTALVIRDGHPVPWAVVAAVGLSALAAGFMVRNAARH